MKKRIIIIASAVLLFSVVVLILYEPPNCPLCSAEKTDIPCLIDLHTGKIAELWVGSRELSDDPSTYVFYMIEVADCDGYCDTAARCCRITLGDARKAMNPFLFCHSCRENLRECRDSQYAVLDLREAAAKTYTLSNGNITIGEFNIKPDEDSVSIFLAK